MKSLHYPGKLDSSLIRRVLGPDDFGGYVVVTRMEYDAEMDRTTAFVRPVLPREVPNITYDQFWQEYLEDSADGSS